MGEGRCSPYPARPTSTSLPATPMGSTRQPVPFGNCLAHSGLHWSPMIREMLHWRGGEGGTELGVR